MSIAEPWELNPGEPGAWHVSTPDNVALMTIFAADPAPVRRAVLCVNQCAGLSDDVLCGGIVRAALWGAKLFQAASAAVESDAYLYAGSQDVALGHLSRVVANVPAGAFDRAAPGPFAPFTAGQVELVAALSQLGRNGLTLLLISAGYAASELPANEVRSLMAAALAAAACPVHGPAVLKYLIARGLLVKANGG